MTDIIPEKSPSDLVRLLPGILVSLIVLVLIFMIVDWRDVLVALHQVDYKFLFLGIPVYLLGYIFRAMAWRTLLKEEVSFKDVFFAMQAGYLFNNVLPFRLGELGRAFLLGRRGLGFWRVLSTILIERTFDMILAAGLLLGTVPFVLGASRSLQVAYFVAAVMFLVMAALYLLARHQVWAVAQYEKISTRWSFLARFGVERLQAFLNGLSGLVHLPRFIRVLTWMVVSWGLTVLYHYIVLLGFHPGAKLLWAGFGLATAALGVALPSSPSYIGIVEAAWIGAFSFFKLPLPLALAYALTVHLLHILISWVLGGYALTREGESFKQIYIEVRKRRFS